MCGLSGAHWVLTGQWRMRRATSTFPERAVPAGYGQVHNAGPWEPLESLLTHTWSHPLTVKPPTLPEATPFMKEASVISGPLP